ncbi:response regulator [Oligoflexaceae bacterium]|nr:response regulator [Oligoflexaceae bacterium]
MTAKILIADSSKPGVVMTSEVFKDKISGAQVFIAHNGEQTIEIVKAEKPDLVMVDFDLPDVDGATLITALRGIYKGPVLLTAFEDDVLKQAVSDMLFAYNDASGWIPKPVKFDVLAEKIETFLIDGKRLGRRFDTELDSMVIGKAEGRGKRAPKVNGTLVNISLGGALINLDGTPMKMKKSQEVTLSFCMPSSKPAKTAKKATKKVTKKAAKKTKTTSRSKKGVETKIKAEVAWYTKEEVGLRFTKLSDVQKRGLESFLRDALVTVDA